MGRLVATKFTVADGVVAAVSSGQNREARRRCGDMEVHTGGWVPATTVFVFGSGQWCYKYTSLLAKFRAFAINK